MPVLPASRGGSQLPRCLALLVALVSPWSSIGICLALAAFYAFSGLAGRG